MATVGSLLLAEREKLGISTAKAARDLVVKEEIITAIENGQYQLLPEPAFVKGIIRSYGQYLNLDVKHLLALYRREFDEALYPNKRLVLETPKKPKFTSGRLVNLTFLLIIIAFVIYIIFQYLSILQAPKLKVTNPQDDLTTTIPVVQVIGQTEKETTISIDGQLVPVDAEGNFSYQLKLNDGQNIIEIIASTKLSPKSKVTKIVRLSR